MVLEVLRFWGSESSEVGGSELRVGVCIDGISNPCRTPEPREPQNLRTSELDTLSACLAMESSYWDERTSAARRPSYPKFRGTHTADAVVIGGGLTGLTAAYVLAKGGLDVVLLEAGRLASGATAGGLGAILPEPDAAFREVDQAAGLKIARTAWQETRRSALDTMAAIRRAGLKCDLAAATLVLNARNAEASVRLKREHAARHAAGLDAAWLTTRTGTAEIATASEGAIRLRDAATYDPVRAALGFAREAGAAGARIFEHSTVRRTRFTRKYADVLADGGSLRTRAVVVATGGPGRLLRSASPPRSGD